MKSVLAIIITASMLQGCALLGWKALEGIEIKKKAVDRTPLNLVDPQPLKPTAPQWRVITSENQAQVFAELKSKNIDQVLFALTDDGYEELAIDIAQIRALIAQQRDIIIRYREYYEPKKKDEHPSK
jgi:hypothetical protein